MLIYLKSLPVKLINKLDCLYEIYFPESENRTNIVYLKLNKTLSKLKIQLSF